MGKYIHYCWFGNKKLTKLAKKCIKSWKKYLPDYEIIQWNENNFDVNQTKFSKEAYKNKKWAFVSDVARVYALKKMGGLYFDTDMLLKENISDKINCNFFAGWESEYNVAAGVLWVKNPNNDIMNRMWEFYVNNSFSVQNVYSISFPILLTGILKSYYNLKNNYQNVQKLDNDTIIYPRDYFYPISCDNTPNQFTKNTCMVHYYIGSWLPKSEILRVKFQMIFGKKLGNFILRILVILKRILRKIVKMVLYPLIKYKKHKNIEKNYENFINDFNGQTQDKKSDNYVVFCNKNWLGTKNVSHDLFENVIEISEINDNREISYISEYILNSKVKLIVFSAFSYGWIDIIKKVRDNNKQIKIKIIWHGSNAMNVEQYDWEMFEQIFKYYNLGYIDSIGFVKKSMYEFYKQKGYNVEFIYNTIHINKSNIEKYNAINCVKENKNINVGLYASGDRWVKNFYNQLAAASLIKNVHIDCIPLNEKSLKMAKIFDAPINGLTIGISREELLSRIQNNDINFYVTFSECAPLFPLESLEMGIPCITGNNHHYWENSELYDYLVVNEEDNIIKIYEKAMICLKNKNKILNLYKDWKIENDKLSATSVKNFLSLDENNKE